VITNVNNVAFNRITVLNAYLIQLLLEIFQINVSVMKAIMKLLDRIKLFVYLV
jgi:hypothetical protein